MLFEAIQKALILGGPWPKRMRRVFGALLAVFADHPQLARVCMVEALAAGAAANQRYRAAVAGLVELVESDALTNRDVPDLPTTMIFGLVGGCSAIIYEDIVEGRTAMLPERADQLTRFWMAGFVGYERVSDEVGGPPAATE